MDYRIFICNKTITLAIGEGDLSIVLDLDDKQAETLSKELANAVIQNNTFPQTLEKFAPL